ncbi:MAG TPA: HepT-like ribonuclease domain-containing protein [Thermoanaerobaculia bacterium]|nr:HepT-like ribonuclease domain-containing protein [Thermoanaerobaculia bacterium]
MHDYFGLDLEIIWEVIQNDLPPLQGHLVERP